MANKHGVIADLTISVCESEQACLRVKRALGPHCDELSVQPLDDRHGSMTLLNVRSSLAALALLVSAGCARHHPVERAPAPPIVSCIDGSCRVDFTPPARTSKVVSAGLCSGGCRSNRGLLTPTGSARLSTLEQRIRRADLSTNTTCPTCPADAGGTEVMLPQADGTSRYVYDTVNKPQEPADLRELSDYAHQLKNSLLRCRASESLELLDACEPFSGLGD